ncbi:hypothetical protein BaRGS_00017076 [Batillaria attramentaria]|uniref:Uncharacterized protein n=1 Tax=Batillaria attramentaria TaxID=370345 RepID=A0ABD0KWT2_9CAEN
MTFSTLESSVLMSSASSYKTAASGCERQNILHILAAPNVPSQNIMLHYRRVRKRRARSACPQYRKATQNTNQSTWPTKQDRPTFGFTSGAARDKRDMIIKMVAKSSKNNTCTKHSSAAVLIYDFIISTAPASEQHWSELHHLQIQYSGLKSVLINKYALVYLY